MAQYYVDSVLGSDANPGSSVSPVKTIARAVTLSTNSGTHQIYLKRGLTYNESIYLYSAFTGTSESNRCVIGSYGPSTNPKPIWTVENLSVAYNLRIGDTTTPVNYTTVEDIHFVGSADSTGRGAGGTTCVQWNTGQATSSTGSIFRRNVVTGTGIKYSSIAEPAYGAAIALSTNGQIVDNTIFNIGSDGFTSSGHTGNPYLNCTIARNKIYNVAMNGLNQGDGMEFGSYALNGVYILNNDIDMTNTYSKQCLIINHAQSDATAGYVLIEGNKFVRKQWGGATSNTPYVNSTVLYVRNPNAIIRRNFMSGGEYGVILANSANGQVLESNIICNSGSAVLVGGGTTNVRFNTIYKARKSPNNLLGVAISKGANAGAVVKNNLMVDCDVGIDCLGAGNNSHNGFWNVDLRYRNSANSTGGDVLTDPKLSPDYVTKPGSPLMGAGTHLGYQRDFRGVQRQNPPAIGAYDQVQLAYT